MTSLYLNALIDEILVNCFKENNEILNHEYFYHNISNDLEVIIKAIIEINSVKDENINNYYNELNNFKFVMIADEDIMNYCEPTKSKFDLKELCQVFTSRQLSYTDRLKQHIKDKYENNVINILNIFMNVGQMNDLTLYGKKHKFYNSTFCKLVSKKIGEAVYKYINGE